MPERADFDCPGTRAGWSSELFERMWSLGLQDAAHGKQSWSSDN